MNSSDKLPSSSIRTTRANASLGFRFLRLPQPSLLWLGALVLSAVSATNAAVTLKGNGVPGILAPGCTPRIAGDFIDSPTWQQRRLLPRDCAVLYVDAPLFSWRQPVDRDLSKPWIFSLRRTTGEVLFSTATSSPRLQLRQHLPPGEYLWDVAYVTTHYLRATITSEARRFTVPAAGFSTFMPPSGAAIASEVVRRSSPRILPVGSSFLSIAGMARVGDYAEEYAALLAEAEVYTRRALPTSPSEPSPTLTARQLSKWKRDTLELLRDEAKRVQTLGFAWRFTGEVRYRDAAIARMMNMASWSPTGATSDASLDAANAKIFTTLSRGFDLFAGALSRSQQDQIVASVKSRIQQTMSNFGDLDQGPYDSHGVGRVQDVVSALLNVAGASGFPEAESWLASSWDLFSDTLATWGAEDGGWGNGVPYGWYMLDGFGDNLASIRIIAGVDMTQSPWIRNLGNFFIANTAPAGTHRSAFGDASETTDLYGWYARDQYRLYAALTRQPQHDWYWRVGAPSVSVNFVPSPYHFMVLGLNLPAVVPAAPTASSFLFEDAGTVAMHDKTSATNRSSVFFRSSRFGSFNHSFADQNSFTLVSKGRDLLISGGYYPWFLSPHHATVTRATRYKNALTFDGGIGQAEPVPNPTGPGKPVQSMDARGKIINYLDRGNWAVTTGDATLAYAGWQESSRTWTPFLSNAVRSIAYNRVERVVVIYDWATSAKNRRWELNFNGLEAFTTSGMSAKVSNTTASACIDVYGADGSFATSQGFDVQPENKQPIQYQARFQSSAPTSELVAVTVIREDCRSVPVAVNVNGTVASVSVNSATAMSFDRRNVVAP